MAEGPNTGPSSGATTRPATQRRSVLISGASFAGLATAFWMDRLGYDVAIVELADAVRRGGTPVDIKGETVTVLKDMGLFELVRAKALPPRSVAFKDELDRTLGTVGGGDASRDGSSHDFEIHRDDLLDILLAATRGSTTILFGRTIARMDQLETGVSVTLDDGSRRDVALVFGCDGNRSNTRTLLFDDTGAASYFMGGYFYLKVVSETGILPANTTEVYSVAGRTAMLNGYDDRTDICLAFRTVDEIDYDYRDRPQLCRLVHEHFDGLGWKVPQMLAYVDAASDFYFDRASQIRVPHWSKGRVALVGDAGYCVSPVAGMGGSMALIGAARLADALRRHPDDHVAAFRAYEEGLRGFVEEVQENAATSGMAIILPANDLELAQRNRRLSDDEVSL